MSETEAAQRPDLETAKFVIVMGSTLPGVHPPMKPLIEPTDQPGGGSDENMKGRWFHIIPTEWQEGAYPHHKHFHVGHQIVVGTIDEIVALFRRQLEIAVDRMLVLDADRDTTPSDRQFKALTWQRQAKMQEILEALVPELEGPEDSASLTLPWIDDDHPAYQAWEKAKFEVAQRAEESRISGNDEE